MTQHRTALITGSAAAVALVLAACGGTETPEQDVDVTRNADATEVTLTFTSNAILGGKNEAEAQWYEDYVIPEFVAQQAEKGVDVTVTFEPNGVDDEQYKTKLALDLQSEGGADVIAMDGIWVGEFAEAGYIAPLTDVAGDDVDDWEGWEQMSEAVQQAAAFDDERYGIPMGADGRVLYFNKTLFEQAGLPTDWEPTSWEDILEAARALKDAGVAIPIQLNAGTAMGEATTMQGLLPLLAGTGTQVWEDGMWMGDTEGLRDALELYRTIYVEEGLGDPILQQEAAGRDTSFSEFAAGNVGILLESDYLWRSVVNPDAGTAPMADRDAVVGYARIPAREPGAGVEGQDFVSMSGGAARVLNPNTEFPQQAWELLAFIHSQEAFENRVASSPIITPRDDVNEVVLEDNPMLSYVATEVLPITLYRPGLAEYPEVSLALQEATAQVVGGMPVEEAAAAYQSALEGIVGADSVSTD
ncbi:extracellular solute-binding protein [Georgenia faecalis]|uniref:Extracellular solute-binding protein n=1 Tax=Georgenia faecalis TaxID=2483799 RepID=A0ABV9DC33_9MICO|nr:extracellular solute-binding protein [Georgenia faecalis]